MANSIEVGDPIDYDDALSRADSELWIDAMREEYGALMENNTWKLVCMPPDRRPIDCKWVYKTKRNNDGNIVRHKARLVIKGCAQRKGVDFEETYAPVVRYNSIRFLLAISAQMNLQIDQMDAVSAFLQGELNETIFMLQPEGFTNGSAQVCQLNKSLYGLKQASRVWNAKLNTSLINLGLTRSDMDPCIYFRKEGAKLLIVAIYVDDILIFANNEQSKSDLKRNLTELFRIKDLGQVSSVLGINVQRNCTDGTITIDQTKYLKEILERFGMSDCKPVTSPLEAGLKLSSEMEPKTEEEREQMKAVPFRAAVGCLMYAAQVSRPDICFATNYVSRFNQNPGRDHWTAVKRIFRYIKGTLKAKMAYKKDGQELVGYCDADWGGDIDSRRSTTGYLFLLNGGAISWNSRKQPTIALSTTEAEYMALSAAAQEAQWLRRLKDEILCTKSGEITIFCDNKSALDLSATTMYHPRTKHIDVRIHYIRELVNNKEIKCKYVSTDKQIADVLTKPLSPCKHLNFVVNFGIIFH